MDCGIPEKQFAQTNDSYVAEVQSDESAHSFHCKNEVKKHISTGADISIAFAVIFFAAQKLYELQS